MAYIKAKCSSPAFVQVPSWFITDYMPKALGGYIKVYLYLLTLSKEPNENGICLEDVCQKLDMLYSEVLQALKYWNQEKVLTFTENADDDFELVFASEAPSQAAAQKKLPISKTIIQQTRPEYRTDEINYYTQNSPDVTKLFKIAEQYLGRLLTISDQKILFSFYDWLHMPFDLIEFLIEYCTSNNHRAMHYIEKVAISWVDEGIMTVEQAKAKTVSDKRYFQILSALGTSKSTLTPAEKKCMSKWLDTYHFHLDIILEACRKTVMQTNKPSLNYVDSILTSWFNEKVKTLDDIKALDKVHESKKLLSESSSKVPLSSVPNKVSKFNNMYSHDWDFDEIEKLERAYIERKLNGGN